MAWYSWTRWTVCAAVLVSVVRPALGCTPIFPLTLSTFGTFGLAKSPIWLLIAVVIKCSFFAIFARDLSIRRAVRSMLLANVVSTLPGIVVTMMMMVPIWSPLGLGILGLGLYFPARSLVLREPRFGRLGTGGITALGVEGLIASFLLFALAQQTLGAEEFWMYWFLKVFYVSAAVAVALFLTVFWEEWWIARTFGGKPLVPVFRANAYTLIIVLAFAAVEMAPRRLQRPGFLTGTMTLLTPLVSLEASPHARWPKWYRRWAE